MKRWQVYAGALVLLAGSAFAGFQLARQQAPAPAAEDHAARAPKGDMIGRPRPDFSLPDLSGDARRPGEWDGRVLVVNFWATWCPPCRDEIPEFITLQRRYGDRGLQFVGIALESAEEVRSFVDEYGMNYPVLPAGAAAIPVAESYGNRFGALPYTVIVDRQGRIAYARPGPLDGATAERVITGLL